MTNEIAVKKVDAYYSEIKEKLISNEVYKRVKDYSKNRNDLNTYYEVGKLLADAGKHYGEGIIKKYSIKLTNELGKIYSERTLKYMRQFYNFQKGQPLVSQLTWSHYLQILPIKDENAIRYYIKITKEQHLSKRELHNRIKLKEYERLDDKTKEKFKENKDVKTDIGDFILNPIILNTDKKIVNEKVLHMVVLENLDSFLNQLGQGYTYVAS